MELLLNIIWLSIVLLAGVRLAVWSAGETDRRRIVVAALATVCVLAVLFPVISISDDMQETVAAVEETIAVRRVVIATALQLASAVIATLTFVSLLAFHLIVVAFTTDDVEIIPVSQSAPAFSLRGPPSFV